MNFHTDDCDGLCEDPRDAKLIFDEFDKKYGVSGVNVRFILGVQRDTTVVNGVTHIHMSQSGYLAVMEIRNRFASTTPVTTRMATHSRINTVS